MSHAAAIEAGRRVAVLLTGLLTGLLTVLLAELLGILLAVLLPVQPGKLLGDKPSEREGRGGKPAARVRAASLVWGCTSPRSPWSPGLATAFGLALPGPRFGLLDARLVLGRVVAAARSRQD